MSGGHFEYNQYKINEIADEVEQLIYDSGKKKTQKELDKESWRDKDWYEKYPEDLFYYKYPAEVIKEFKKGLNYLRKAAIYTQRIDWLVSGDDGDESFIRRLKEDLSKLKR